MSTGNKETVYDEQIAPLMAAIITIAKEHGIGMAATFQLDDVEEGDPLYCSTTIPGDDPGNHLNDCIDTIVAQVHTPMVAITITREGVRNA